MMKPRILLAVLLGSVSCGTKPVDPPIPSQSTESSAITAPGPPNTWCSAIGRTPTHELVLSVSIPKGRRAVSLVMPMVSCSEVEGDFKRPPSTHMNADSLEPSAWFNASVSVTSSSVDSITADIDFSWHTEQGAEGECPAESITVPLSAVSRVSMRCGATIVGHFQRAAGRSNIRLNPAVGSVTGLACASPAPAPPAG